MSDQENNRPAYVARILREVLAERDRQDARRGGPEHDAAHLSGYWRDLIVDRANLSIGAAVTRDVPLQRRYMLEIVALAIANIERLNQSVQPK